MFAWLVSAYDTELERVATFGETKDGSNDCENKLT